MVSGEIILKLGNLWENILPISFGKQYFVSRSTLWKSSTACVLAISSMIFPIHLQCGEFSLLATIDDTGGCIKLYPIFYIFISPFTTIFVSYITILFDDTGRHSMFSKIVFFVLCFAAKSPTGAKRHLDSSVLATSDINVHFRY